MKLKENNFDALSDYGFGQSKVAIYPTKLFKVVDVNKQYVIEICNDKINRNMWSGEDVNDVGILKLWECEGLDLNYKWRDGEISAYYDAKRTDNKLLPMYVQDLILAGLV